MFSLFFIRRPIVASVIAILIVIGGIVVYPTLPVAQYPDITPPVVSVETSYPGASAQIVADSVATSIEDQVNGVDKMLYMESNSGSDGSYTLNVTFAVGTNPDLNSVLVQNRVSAATASLPEQVQKEGVTTEKKSTNLVQVITLVPKDEKAAKKFDDLFLANYIAINLDDKVKRIRGVGGTGLYPAKDYAMRVWLNPEKLQSRDLTVEDAINALKEQNVVVAAGLIGQPPAPPDQAFQYTINAMGRLKNAEEFENVILKSDDKRIVRIRDVGRVELGAKSYDTLGRVNGVPSGILLIYQSPGANAVQIAKDVRKLIDEFRTQLPEGIEVNISYDTSEFVEEAIHEVKKTLYEAVILVLIVVLIFLGGLRSTLIPILTIPVSLIGTFLFMKVFGFSVNLPTLFGLVLAIGIVVDDAIVVVENVERVSSETHLPMKQATAKAMIEVFGAIVGISLVLMAVFGPTAALPGISGELYRQFAVTIAASTFLSAICALTLSPALAGVILKAHKPGQKSNWFKRTFDRAFNATSNGYAALVSFLVKPAVIAFSLLGFIGACGAVVWSLTRVPLGFVPAEDKGIILTEIWLPDAASQERVLAALKKVEHQLEATDGIETVSALGGYSLINGNGVNYATIFSTLKPWSVRVPKKRDLETIRREIQARCSSITDGIILSYGMPPIEGLGTGTGFDLRIQDQGSVGREVLAQAVEEVIAASRSEPAVEGVSSAFRPGVPQLFADIDREKVIKLNVPLQSVFTTLGASLGPAYVNDFNLFDRTWRVYVQAEGKFRSNIDDITSLEVRNSAGQMLPLGSVLDVRPDFGPDKVFRYNLYPAAFVSGNPAPGHSSGEALAAMEQVLDRTLPPGVGYEWTAMAFQEKATGGQGGIVFALALLVVYLILAALYENWLTPFAVILSIPLAVLGAMLGLMWRGMDNNIYTQVGLVLLVGLGAKNAILIVEFARANRIAGMGLIESAVDAARLRLRPILMTAFAFILGVLPLVIATGAGAASRQAIGTAVFFGMIGNTFLGLFFTPVLFVTMTAISEKLFGRQKPDVPIVIDEIVTGSHPTPAH